MHCMKSVQIRTRNNSILGHFSRSDGFTHIYPSPLREWGSLARAFFLKFAYMARHFILLRLNPFDLELIGRGGGLSTLCHSCGFACQQRVLKTFSGPGYLRSENTSITSNKIASNVPIYF